MSDQSFIAILIVGLIAGWLAGKIVRGTGFGLIGDLLVGILGAFIGGWLLPRVGVHVAPGLVGSIIDATVGAVVLLLIINLIQGGGGWRRSRWGHRWG